MKAKSVLLILCIVALSVWLSFRKDEPAAPLLNRETVESTVISAPQSRAEPRPEQGAPKAAAVGAAGASPRLSSRVQEDVRRLAQVQATPEGKLVLNPRGGDANQLVVDLRGKPAELARMVRAAGGIATLMADCLQDNLCDQGPEDGYFDPGNTPGHRMLNKALQFLNAAADFSSVREGFPSEADLLSNFKVRNSETQMLSLEILLKRPPSDSLRAELLAQAPLVRDEAKAQYLEAMQRLSAGSPEARRQFLETFYQSLRGDDVGTVSKTVENLGLIRLSHQEFRQAVSSLCHIKQDPGTNRSWGPIRYGLTVYGETHGVSADPDQLCS